MPRSPEVILNLDGYTHESQGNYGFVYLTLLLVDRIMQLESHSPTSANVYKDVLDRLRPFCLHNGVPNQTFAYIEQAFNTGRHRYSKVAGVYE